MQSRHAEARQIVGVKSAVGLCRKSPRVSAGNLQHSAKPGLMLDEHLYMLDEHFFMLAEHFFQHFFMPVEHFSYAGRTFFQKKLHILDEHFFTLDEHFFLLGAYSV